MKEYRLSDEAALSKVQEGCSIIEQLKEMDLGSFKMSTTKIEPKVMAEISPKRSIKRFVEIDIKLRSYLT